ncbi:hypothetical protein CAPTEDRAFT_197126 [Capitella teleta]|uniref:Uncharacterized protein n=1 Tax=Capitella teleta TaxID=283909 RepID=R7TRQ5_CAPTE|nr:hypothetical protein CAPTEDRAFT_197126 [Capitella teleta]|eukprot:ELT93715.1 hypothetical protein CAPTEDRAFT_197126 [Capitella teleta]
MTSSDPPRSSKDSDAGDTQTFGDMETDTRNKQTCFAVDCNHQRLMLCVSRSLIGEAVGEAVSASRPGVPEDIGLEQHDGAVCHLLSNGSSVHHIFYHYKQLNIFEALVGGHSMWCYNIRQHPGSASDKCIVQHRCSLPRVSSLGTYPCVNLNLPAFLPMGQFTGHSIQ